MMRKEKKRQETTVDELNDELFLAVETSQGKSYISDGMGCLPREAFFDGVRQSLWYTLATAQAMKKFLVKYGEEEPAAIRAEKAECKEARNE